MTDGNLAMSSGIVIMGNAATVTIDDTAFPMQVSDRVTGRTQTIVRGVFTMKTYKGTGVPCNLTKLTSRFPNGNYRVITEMDETGTYYACYNHTTKALVMYEGLNNVVDNGVDLSSIVVPFIAVGE